MLAKFAEFWETMPEAARRLIRWCFKSAWIVGLVIIAAYAGVWLYLSAQSGEFSNFWEPFRWIKGVAE